MRPWPVAEDFRTRIEITLSLIQGSLYARWIIANMIAWPMGFIVASLILNGSTVPLLRLLVGGAILGGLVGVAQAMAVGRLVNVRRWTLWSAAISTVAFVVVIPVTLLAMILGGPVAGMGLGGALFAAALGLVQAMVMGGADEILTRWIGACTLGGCACGSMTFAGFPVSLPVLCSLGPLVFGLITGYTLQTIVRQLD